MSGGIFMVLVEELKNNEGANLNPNIWDMVPNYCMDCGAPLTINPALTGLSCSDNFCIAKVANRCANFMKQIGFLGLGEATLKNVCDEYEIYSPVMLYSLKDALDEDVYESDAGIDRKLVELTEFLEQHNEFTLAEYLTLANIPSLQKASAEALASDYDDLPTLLSDIEANGPDLVRELLGIQQTEVSLRSIKIYEQLMEHENLLLYPYDQGLVTITTIDPNLIDVSVVISDGAGGGWKTKKKFQEAIKNEFSDKFNVDFKAGVSKKVDIVVAPEGTNTSKVRKAHDYGIPVVEGDDLIEQLDISDDLDSLVNNCLNL